MRNRFILAALALFSLGAAPLSAQEGTGLPQMVQHRGDPVPYRIGLPKGWEIQRDDKSGMLGVAREGKVMLAVMALDLLPSPGPGLPPFDEEQRRVLTRAMMDSDSILFGLMGVRGEVMSSGGTMSGVVHEIRTLGGERAGYMSARLEGRAARLEMYLTVQDGVVYMLVMAVHRDSAARYAPVFAAMRESMVLAGPVSGWASRPAAPPARQ